MSRQQTTVLLNQRPSPGGPANEPQPSRRGGPRPGAGAPRGNTNALRSGRYSQRVRALEQLLEDMSWCAFVIGFLAAPRQQELRRLAYALQRDARALLDELRGATGRRNQSNVPVRFAARTMRRRVASEAAL